MRLSDPRNRAALATLMELIEERLASAEVSKETGVIRMQADFHLHRGAVVAIDPLVPQRIAIRLTPS